MLIALLIALVALPFSGVILALILSRLETLRHLYWLCLPLTVILAIVAAWLLRPEKIETVIGNWSPVSFTGTPLVLATNPEGSVLLIACLITLLIASASDDGAFPSLSRSVASAFIFAGMVITVYANNLVTLLIGISLVDILSAIMNMRWARASRQHSLDFLFHAASLAVIVIAFALYDATGNSLYLPLARIPGNVLQVISVALALRFSLVPLRAVSERVNDDLWIDKASLVTGFVLIARLMQFEAPQLRAWFFGLAIFTGILALIVGILSGDRSRLQTGVDAGALAAALTSAALWQPAVAMAAASVWLFGTTLLSRVIVVWSTRLATLVKLIRMIGAACLLGLPFTIGFIARAGVIASWSPRGMGGGVLIVGLAVLQMLLTIGALNLVFWPELPQPNPPHRLMTYFVLFALLLADAHVVLFGMSPGLTGAPALGEELQRPQLVGWLVWLASTLAGGLVWWLQPRWLRRLEPARDRMVPWLDLGWWQNILGGSIGRIGQPLGSVFAFLESDGALIWAVIVLLIVVLVTRPGGP